jgi:hypothetical protein
VAYEDMDERISRFWEALDVTKPFEGACKTDLNSEWLMRIFTLMDQWDTVRKSI